MVWLCLLKLTINMTQDSVFPPRHRSGGVKGENWQLCGFQPLILKYIFSSKILKYIIIIFFLIVSFCGGGSSVQQLIKFSESYTTVLNHVFENRYTALWRPSIVLLEWICSITLWHGLPEAASICFSDPFPVNPGASTTTGIIDVIVCRSFRFQFQDSLFW